MSKEMGSLARLPDRNSLKQAIEAAVQKGEPTALTMVDVDNFAEVNDRFGHASGDHVLEIIVESLLGGGAGEVYHVSGDEFAVLLPGFSLEQAFLYIDGIRGRVHDARNRFALPDCREVTITAGVAQFPRDARDYPALMSAADAALAAAKESGRNNVALPPNEEMVMKSCYYSATKTRKLRALAEKLNRKESVLLREALDDLLRRYDLP